MPPRPDRRAPWLLLLVLLCAGCHRPERAQPTRHLIPEGYMGDVFVIHSHLGGSVPAVEGDFRLLEIPPSGVLLTRDPPETGVWLKDELQYHWVDADGERTKLWHRVAPIRDEPAHRALEGVMVVAGTGGSVRTADCTHPYRRYVVGTAAFLLDEYEPLEIDELLERHPEICGGR